MKKYTTGEIRNGFEVLSPEKRQTILLLSDDMRMSSGVATMTKEFVMGMVHHYNFIQLASAINHPEKGNELDLSKDVSDRTGVDGVSIKLIPWTGYGDPNILRHLLMKFRPNAILHFTDPRYFKWLYDMEAEIRENIPIMYYNIWDNVGTPDDNYGTDAQYNDSYYASCNGLFAISKQTYGMNNRVLQKGYPNEIKIC